MEVLYFIKCVVKNEFKEIKFYKMKSKHELHCGARVHGVLKKHREHMRNFLLRACKN